MTGLLIVVILCLFTANSILGDIKDLLEDIKKNQNRRV